MTNLNNKEIKDLISIDIFNDTSLFAVSVIDLPKYELVYANQAMKNIMSDLTAVNCWEAIYGQESPCMWCKAPALLANIKANIPPYQSTINNGYIIYEHFNEVANKWFQMQEKVVTLKDSRTVLISIALDISLQKEAQSKLIDTHVKLTRQTQALQEAQAKLKEQANRDPMTNMHNRRYFAEMSEKIVSIAKRTKEPLGFMMIDIDNFKNVNDTYGHNVGDEVIKLLANKLISRVRESDIAARFGGEEFAIMLPNANLKSTSEVAETIRLEAEQIKYNDDLHFTISIGVSELNHEDIKSVTEALNNADKALYEAKVAGRNRVSIFNLGAKMV